MTHQDVEHPKLCIYCDNPKHSSDECYMKEQYERYAKYCHYCEDHGHFEDTCPLVEEAAKKQSKGSCKKAKDGEKKSKRPSKTHLKSNEKLCSLCNSIEHYDSKCHMNDFYNKYCRYCKDFGHCEDTCSKLSASANRKEGYGIDLTKSIQEKLKISEQDVNENIDEEEDPQLRSFSADDSDLFQFTSVLPYM